MSVRIPYHPVLVLDVGGFSNLGGTQKRAVRDRIDELLEAGVRPLFGEHSRPMSSVDSWDAGDGFYAVFHGLGAHGALLVARNMCELVSRQDKPAVDRLIRLRLVLGHGAVEKVPTRGGMDRWEGEVLTEITRLVDSPEIRDRLAAADRPAVLAATREFLQSWELDPANGATDRALRIMRRDFSTTDKHGNIWEACFMDCDDGETLPAADDSTAHEPASAMSNQGDKGDPQAEAERRVVADPTETALSAPEGSDDIPHDGSPRGGSKGEKPPGPKKVFLSYTSSDADWAQWIGWTLKEAGHVPFLHDWEVGFGQSPGLWMERRLDEADRILELYSPAYLTAKFSTSERNAAYWFDAIGERAFGVALKVREVDLPRLQAQFRYLSIVGLAEAAAREQVLSIFDEPAPPSRPPAYPEATSADTSESDVLDRGRGTHAEEAAGDDVQVRHQAPIHEPAFPAPEATLIVDSAKVESSTRASEEEQQQWLEKVRDRTAELITSTVRFRGMLVARSAGEQQEQPESRGTEHLADLLLGLPFQEAMQLVEEAFNRAKDARESDEVRAIRGIARWIGPAMFSPQIVARVRASVGLAGSPIIPVEVATVTAAELIIAGVRGTAFENVTWCPETESWTNDDRMEFPPELGDGTTAEVQADAMADQLMSILAPGPRNRQRSRTERIRIANASMEQHARRGRVWCAFFEPGFNDGPIARAAAELLKQQFPKLVFLELLDDIDRAVEEIDMLWAIRVIEEDAGHDD